MALPYPAPVGQTARRLDWVFLPAWLRDIVEEQIGTTVTEARSQTSGFTPGFASVLIGADGSRHFVKAASVKAQRMFADAYREEARKLAVLPADAPAPQLLWTYDDDEWVVLGIEHVEGRAPRRPWSSDDLEASLSMLTRVVEVLTPPPPGLVLDDFATEFADFPGYWQHVAETRGFAHATDAAALAARYREVTAGSTVVHTDVRDDNLIVTEKGVVMCDWNWPVVGAPWLDSLLLLIGPRGDGLDVEAVLAEHPRFAEVPAEAIDIVLALVTGYFFKAGDDPVPHTSPHIRSHQLWQGEVTWTWLCERRGWDPA